ncbi:TniB family NTP-binding protein [Roseovarius sp. D0-M9]|uniref:TniB family NTP-binding protein n=1 Tax=Roseovarius sp. D0-M9 TaxID=3127117 RepID=UPI00300F82CA
MLDHLMSVTVPLLQANDAVRIAHVRAPRWINHPAAGAAHDAMRQLLERPPSLRPRGLFLSAPTTTARP